jgi:hypothetical protein
MLSKFRTKVLDRLSAMVVCGRATPRHEHLFDRLVDELIGTARPVIEGLRMRGTPVENTEEFFREFVTG